MTINEVKSTNLSGNRELITAHNPFNYFAGVFEDKSFVYLIEILGISIPGGASVFLALLRPAKIAAR